MFVNDSFGISIKGPDSQGQYDDLSIDIFNDKENRFCFVLYSKEKKEMEEVIFTIFQAFARVPKMQMVEVESNDPRVGAAELFATDDESEVNNSFFGSIGRSTKLKSDDYAYKSCVVFDYSVIFSKIIFYAVQEWKIEDCMMWFARVEVLKKRALKTPWSTGLYVFLNNYLIFSLSKAFTISKAIKNLSTSWFAFEKPFLSYFIFESVYNTSPVTKKS